MTLLKQTSFAALALFIILGATPLSVHAKTYDDSTGDRYTIETAYFRITQMPTTLRQGRIAVYDSLEDQLSNCRACAKLLYLSSNTQIRVGHEGSMYSVEDVVSLPPQPVYLVVDNGVVVKIGFTEIDLGDLDSEI